MSSERNGSPLRSVSTKSDSGGPTVAVIAWPPSCWNCRTWYHFHAALAITTSNISDRKYGHADMPLSGSGLLGLRRQVVVRCIAHSKSPVVRVPAIRHATASIAAAKPSDTSQHIVMDGSVATSAAGTSCRYSRSPATP